MKRYIYLTLFFFILSHSIIFAQRSINLQQAIEIGIKNNPDVRQSDILMQKADAAWKQTKEEMLPDLNIGANHGYNFGRSIDPFTNSFIDQKVGYASYSAGSSILLFNGFSLQNAVKTNKLSLEASREELQQAKDNLTINIILAYLQVLKSKDLLNQAAGQMKVSREQTDRLAILNDSGAILPSDYYDLKGQLANDQINQSDSKAALISAKLSLLQLLNLPYQQDFDVEPLSSTDTAFAGAVTSDSIYHDALQNFAQIKAITLRTESSRKNIRYLKGQLYPVLTFSGNVNTNYSTVATRDFYTNTTIVTSGNYVVVNGTQYPVIVKQDNFDIRKINYRNQLNNNLFYTLDVGLRIPLFNAGRVRSQIKQAKLDLKSAELKEENSRIQLQQAIEQAYVNFVSAQEKYHLLKDQVQSFEESFRVAEVRFNAGIITSVDYLAAKNNLDRSRGNLITAQYDLVLRKKILDYYRGKQLH